MLFRLRSKSFREVTCQHNLMQRNVNKIPASLRRICKRSDQPKIERLETWQCMMQGSLLRRKLHGTTTCLSPNWKPRIVPVDSSTLLGLVSTETGRNSCSRLQFLASEWTLSCLPVFCLSFPNNMYTLKDFLVHPSCLPQSVWLEMRAMSFKTESAHKGWFWSCNLFLSTIYIKWLVSHDSWINFNVDKVCMPVDIQYWFSNYWLMRLGIGYDKFRRSRSYPHPLKTHIGGQGPFSRKRLLGAFWSACIQDKNKEFSMFYVLLTEVIATPENAQRETHPTLALAKSVQHGKMTQSLSL